MKKRKSPLVLISILVVLFGVVAVINGFVSNAADPEYAQKKALEEAKREAERSAPDASQASLVDAASEGVSKRSTKAIRAKGATSKSTLVRQKSQAPKPKPIDSDVSNQWYNPESRKPTDGG